MLGVIADNLVNIGSSSAKEASPVPRSSLHDKTHPSPWVGFVALPPLTGHLASFLFAPGSKLAATDAARSRRAIIEPMRGNSG